MVSTLRIALLLLLATTADPAAAQPAATDTVVLGPFTGHHAPLHPNNATVDYYGTDLGWSYVHRGQIQFLFGDTWKNELGEPVSRTLDDAFGTIDLSEWPNGARISASAIPRLDLAVKAGTNTLATLDPGVPMEALKTPVGGFSNGSREFAVFITGKPQACRADADCSTGFTCDAGIGHFGDRADLPAGLTLACEEGSNGCNADTLFDSDNKRIKDSGLCVDTTSSIWSNTPSGRTSAASMQHLIGMRDPDNAARYTSVQTWHTTKFINVAVRSVDDFVATRASQDYRNTATSTGINRRVFLWGRPEFIGVNGKGQTLSLYFAYANMPGDVKLAWQPHYFTGVDATGAPQFSSDERAATPLDLDSTQTGIQSREPHDIVQHMSIVWIDALKKWVMFDGGGINTLPLPLIAPNCGLLEIFARTECKNVVIGNGAIRMRVADNPWGPWSPTQDLIIGGDAERRPTEHQYAAGGVLHHPECKGERCESRSLRMPKGDYGWLYGANIIEPWITATDTGVDVIWNASTWDPYRVILLKTRIAKSQ